jgi:hypothetical protein
MTAQEKIASSCSEAMLGYANAATAAYWTMTRQTLAFWADTARSLNAPASSAESWFKPDRPARTALFPQAHGLMAGWGALPNNDDHLVAFAPFTAFMPAHMRIWLSMFPIEGPLAAWPMAYAMMCAGAPRSVAWPAAKANAALMEATEVATQSVASAFASYRSDGGHAAAHMVWKQVPMSVSIMWLSAFGMSPLWQAAMRTSWPSA